MEWLINIIYYVVPFIVLLGILVFVHEFGHFIVARMSGVQVEAFSIGFGKMLWSRKDKHGTEWKLSAIPLGGYCQFLGDADGASAKVDEKAKKLTKEEKKRAFAFQNPFKKLAIVLAGPLANYLFAVLVFACVYTFVGKVLYPPVVGEVMEGGAAQKAGIQAQDRIVTVNGHKIHSFDDIRKEIALVDNENMVTIQVLRGVENLFLTFPITELEFHPDCCDCSKVVKQRMLGIRSLNQLEVEHKRLNPFFAVKEAVAQTIDITEATLRGVGQMIAGKRSSEDIGGIIRIAEMSGDISKQNGWLDFVMFMALLSINLGLINLFPIPLLDGGHVVIFLLEIVTGKEMNEKVKEVLFKLGFGLLILLMVFATWNDVVRLFKRWFD